MNDNLRKLLLYSGCIAPYWELTRQNTRLTVAPGAVGRYPLDLMARLEQGHYRRFDAAGLPVRIAADGQIYRNYTTLCSYALAHWERYLITGNRADAEKLLQIADYIVENTLVTSDGARLVADDRNSQNRRLSAMNQGEAMSVLMRAWEYTQQESYSDAALQSVVPFTKGLDEQGVTHPFRGDRTIPWYEEYAVYPVRHVLNGMVYALWGLRDVVLVTGSGLAGELFDRGVQSLVKALPYFDTGRWSYYAICDVGETHPIASMMYHNLHIVQLTALYQQTRRVEFMDAAKRFRKYSDSIWKRWYAGLMLLLRKVRGL